MDMLAALSITTCNTFNIPFAKLHPHSLREALAFLYDIYFTIFHRTWCVSLNIKKAKDAANIMVFYDQVLYDHKL